MQSLEKLSIIDITELGHFADVERKVRTCFIVYLYLLSKTSHEACPCAVCFLNSRGCTATTRGQRLIHSPLQEVWQIIKSGIWSSEYGIHNCELHVAVAFAWIILCGTIVLLYRGNNGRFRKPFIAISWELPRDIVNHWNRSEKESVQLDSAMFDHCPSQVRQTECLLITMLTWYCWTLRNHMQCAFLWFLLWFLLLC